MADQHPTTSDAGDSNQLAEEEQIPYDPRLDFFSPSFDALYALYTPSLRAPRQRTRTLPSLEHCKALLPPEIDIDDGVDALEAPNQSQRPQEEDNHDANDRNRKREDPNSREARRARAISRGKSVHRRALSAAADVESRFAQIIARHLPDIKASGASSSMQDFSENEAGPLSVIATAVSERRRVRIVTRHRRGVRGSMIGLVLLFDEHCNMVMRDVDEEYVVRLRRGRRIERIRSVGSTSMDLETTRTPNEYGVEQNQERINKKENELVGNMRRIEGESMSGRGTEETVVRYRPKTEKRRRHLSQVLLRGESIVLVQLLDEMR